MENRNLSLSTVAGSLGVSERTVRRWIQSGKLRAYKPGRDYRIPESAVRALVEESEISPKAPRRSSPEPSLFNGVLENERRDSTPYELKAIETIGGVCDRLERFLDDAERKNIDPVFWVIEGQHAIDIAAVSLPLIERAHLRSMLVPVAARLVQLANDVFDGARDAGGKEEAEESKMLIRTLTQEIA